MTDATNHSVVGTDGVVPSYNPEGLWKTWAISEVYMGTVGKKRYVPKVDDHVIDPKVNTRWIVKELDQITLIPVLEPLGSNNSVALSSTDLLFATGPGWPSQNYRIYFDDTVYPYRVDVHFACQIRAVNAAYVRAIRGSIYGDHEVISEVYDATGTFVTDQVGMDLLAVEPGWQNYHIKTVKTFNTTKRLVNGEPITLLVYSQDGHLLGQTVLAVTESNFIRHVNTPKNMITHISVDSPFVSENDPTVLKLPLNWNINSMNIEGVVHYRDGKKVKLPIDGRKFSLRGYQQLLSSIPGQPMDMVLHYKLDSDEATIHETSSFNNGINLPLRVELTEANFSYSVKLFVYPYWNQAANRYDLRWFLMNLDRNVFMEVTNQVRFAANSAVFDGMRFGTVQRFQVALNLKDVFPTYKPFVHTQVCEVTLYGVPRDYPGPWVVKHSIHDNSVYGHELRATIVTNDSLTIHNDLDFDNWYKALYLNAGPILEFPEDPDDVIKPTHFVIEYNGNKVEYPIESFDQVLVIPTTLNRFNSLNITFFRRVSTGDLYCAQASLVLQLN